MPEQRARTVEILAENEQKFNMQIFSGVNHGFAVSLRSFYTYHTEQCVLIVTDTQSSSGLICGLVFQESFRKFRRVVQLLAVAEGQIFVKRHGLQRHTNTKLRVPDT
jgi:hypothetical protein